MSVATAATRPRPVARRSRRLRTARHGDPFAVLGPHEAAAGRVIRAFLPGAQSRRGAAPRRSARRIGQLDANASTGLFRGHRQRARTVSAAHRHGRRRSQETEDPYSLRAAAGRARPASVQRRPPLRPGACARRQRRRPSTASTGVRFAVWAPNAAPRRGGRRFQRLGRAPPSDAAAPSAPGVWELFVPARRRRRALQVRHRRRQAACACRRRPTRWRSRPSCRPRTASVVARPRRPLAATAPGWRSRAARHAARRADLDLRGASRLVAARAETASASSTWDELADRLIPYVARHGLHACRAAADHRASVRRLVGLPAARPVRADRAASARRRTSRASSTRCHAAGIGVHPRLGAGAFPDRCARPRALRRHRALRARRPARGLPSATGTR